MSNIGTKFLIAQRFVFDPNNNSLIDQMNGNDLVRLGSNESRILLLLCENPNDVLSRHELHEFVWREQGFEVDDSSLTQAISTLRKMLKDSTKSPEFVKTVPKRGYQLICPVERLNALCGEPLPIVTKPERDEEIEPVIELEQAPSTELDCDENLDVDLELVEEIDVKKPRKTLLSRTNALLLALLVSAVMIPLAVLYLTPAEEARFRELAVINNVKVLVPNNHPDIKSWLPTIERCINKYTESRQGRTRPAQVIATGGQNHQLVINYIHHLDYSGQNVTLRLFTDEQALDEICQ